MECLNINNLFDQDKNRSEKKAIPVYIHFKRNLNWKTVLLNLLVLSLLSQSVFSQDAADLKDELEKVEKRLSGLEAKKRELDKKVNILADEIFIMKSEKPGKIKFLGRYKLDKKLRKSQKLSDELQILEGEIAELRKTKGFLINRLIAYYNDQIYRLLERIKNEENRDVKLQLVDSLVNFKMARDKFKISIPPLRWEAAEPLIGDPDSLESPDLIVERIDLLKDLEERYLEKARAIDEKIGILEEEEHLRTKMDEFIKDFVFFHEIRSTEGEKRLIKSSTAEPSRGEENVFTGFQQDSKENINELRSAEKVEILKSPPQVEKLDLTPVTEELNPWDLQDIIEKLKRKKDVYMERAKELNTQIQLLNYRLSEIK